MRATRPIDTTPQSGVTATKRLEAPRRRREKRPFVLIVDDDPDARAIHAEILQRMGFRTAEAASGEEGIEMAFACAPDVILMDASMPGIGGFAAARRLKRAALTHTIPIVMLTGYSPLGRPRESGGCDAFLGKPSTPDDLAATLRSVLDA